MKQFIARLNGAALKLENSGEAVTDTAKLTRLMQANSGHGSVYDKPNIDYDQAAGLFEGLENSGLATPAPHSVI